jgi:hypothetical protein
LIGEFTPLAGNILRNPIDYSQNVMEPEKLLRTVRIVCQWEGIDFLIWFPHLPWVPLNKMDLINEILHGIVSQSRAASKPLAIVLQANISPEQVKKFYSFAQKCVSSELPVYYSFASAANAIDLVLNHHERRLGTSLSGA